MPGSVQRPALASERDLAAGFALAAGGGLNAALETVGIVKSQAAEQQTRQASASATSGDRHTRGS